MWQSIRKAFGIAAGPTYIRSLRRQEVIGSPIRRVRYEYRVKSIDGWLDVGQTYFTLESAVSFGIPNSGDDAFQAVKVPYGSRSLPTEDRNRLVGDYIVDAYRCLHEGEESGEQAVLQLASGAFVTEIAAAPHGTGSVGLYVRSPAEWEAMAREWDEGFTLVSFWAPRPSPQ